MGIDRVDQRHASLWAYGSSLNEVAKVLAKAAGVDKPQFVKANHNNPFVPQSVRVLSGVEPYSGRDLSAFAENLGRKSEDECELLLRRIPPKKEKIPRASARGASLSPREIRVERVYHLSCKGSRRVSTDRYNVTHSPQLPVAFVEEAERRLQDDFRHSPIKKARDFIGPLFEPLRIW